MKFYKPNFWKKKYYNIYSLILLPISIVIQFLFFIQKGIISPKKFNIPVICVGNIYIGGTGKTPLTLELYNILKSMNKNPAIVKKFYKNHYDEIELIKQNVGNLFLNSSRKKAMDEVQNKNFDVAILDDGYQDCSIKKDLKILCFNEKQLIGNGHTIPSGPLREKLSSIKKSQIVVINGNENKNFENKLKKIFKDINIFYSRYISEIPKEFNNKKFLAFAGIGNPENFFDTLREYGLNVTKSKIFPDHYSYKKNEIENLLDLANKNKLDLITTEKDHYRLKKLGFNINYLKIKVQIEKKDKFEKLIKSYI
tara:strand:+ start:578 stop:1507 length:930 start_codon:yes stop_codon:yes gene_type:complete